MLKVVEENGKNRKTYLEKCVLRAFMIDILEAKIQLSNVQRGGPPSVRYSDRAQSEEAQVAAHKHMNKYGPFIDLVYHISYHKHNG